MWEEEKEFDILEEAGDYDFEDESTVEFSCPDLDMSADDDIDLSEDDDDLYYYEDDD